MIHINLKNDLVHKVKKEALKQLEDEPEEYFYRFQSPLKSLIAFLYSEKIINQRELEIGLEVAVITQAFRNYDFQQEIKKKDKHRNAGYLASPEFLVHVLDIDFLRPKEINKLKLGQDAESFCNAYRRENLIEGLVKELEQYPVQYNGTDARTQEALDQLENDNFMRTHCGHW